MWTNGQVKKRAVFFALIIALPHCYGQKFSFGSCPQLSSKPGITLTGITPSYNVDALTPSIQWHGWNCIKYVISLATITAPTISITGIQKITGNFLSTAGKVVIFGTTTPMSAADTSLAITTYNGLFPKTHQYYIIDVGTLTSPNYLVLYSCRNHFPGKLEDVLILYKSGATALEFESARASLQSIGYPLHYLRRGFDGC